MKKLWIVLPFIFATTQALCAHHFTDIYETETGWRVEHFSAESNQLQKHLGSKNFRYKVQAEQYASALLRTYPQLKSFSFVAKELNAAPLWTVTKSWDATWEKKYSDWVKKEFDANFFIRYGLATDCADVAYALRWIFARNNQLPAAATLGGSNQIVTHLTAKKEWDKLPGHALWYKDQRFMTALRWLLEMVYTKTLYKDTYPVKLTRNSVQPGLINHIGAHTEVFRQVSSTMGEVPLIVLSSTVPQALRVLNERVYIDSEPVDRTLGGLVQFRWPLKSRDGWSITAKEKMPDYSLEQYSRNLCSDQSNFALCVLQKLNIAFDSKLIAKKLVADLENTMTFRVGVVNDGMTFCSQNDCTPGTVGYEDWSTPSRDKRLKASFKTTKDVLTALDVADVYLDWLATATINVPKTIKVSEFAERLKYGFVSNDPRATLDQRWGATQVAMEQTIRDTEKEITSVRESLITAAADCRTNADSCISDGQSFNLLSTVDPDQDLRELYDHWLVYAPKANLTVTTEFKEKYFSLWSRSPAPWDSLTERYGKRSSSGHYLRAKSIEAGPTGKLILDQNRIYDLSSRMSRSSFGYSLVFDETTGYLLGQDKDFLRVYKDSTEIARFGLQGYRSRIVFAHKFGNGQLLIAECLSDAIPCYGTKIAWVLDLINLAQGDPVRFFQDMKREKNGPALIGDSQLAYSFLPSGDGIDRATLPYFEANDIAHRKNHEYVAIIKNTQLSVASPDGVKNFAVISPSQVLDRRDESHLLYGKQNAQILNGVIDLETLVVTPLKISAGPKVGSSFSTAAVFGAKGMDLAIFDNGNFRILNLGLNYNYSPIVSSGREWFSLETGAVMDYQGNTLEPSSGFMKGLCQLNNYNYHCSGTNENLMIEHFMSPYTGAEFYKSYARIGLNSHRTLSQILAYGIVRPVVSSDDGGEDVINSTGTAIPLGESYVLWFP